MAQGPAHSFGGKLSVRGSMRALVKQFASKESAMSEQAVEKRRGWPSEHRAQYEHERERADLLARGHEELDIQLKNLRSHLQAGRQAAAPQTLRDWWLWL